MVSIAFVYTYLAKNWARKSLLVRFWSSSNFLQILSSRGLFIEARGTSVSSLIVCFRWFKTSTITYQYMPKCCLKIVSCTSPAHALSHQGSLVIIAFLSLVWSPLCRLSACVPRLENSTSKWRAGLLYSFIRYDTNNLKAESKIFFRNLYAPRRHKIRNMSPQSLLLSYEIKPSSRRKKIP